MKKLDVFTKTQIAIIIGIIGIVFTISIAYSSIYSNLYISGDVTIRTDTDIRLTNITLTSSIDGAYENYSPLYNVDNFTISMCLPNISSEITYKVTFENNSGSDIIITKLSPSIYDNKNITYKIDGLEVNDIVGESVDFTITLKNDSSVTDATCLNLVMNIGWEKYDSIPLTVSIDTLEGDTTSSDYGSLFVLTVTNNSSSTVNYTLNSSSSDFNVYDENGNTPSFSIDGKTTENVKIYVKETSDSVLDNTTQNTDLILNTKSREDASIIIGTLTLTLPDLPKYTMVSNGVVEESNANIDYSKVDSSGDGAVYKTIGPSGGEVYF
jgi:hypothetical protein